jgi:TRAP-type C4-dicarboxylate transport system permease small subunit
LSIADGVHRAAARIALALAILGGVVLLAAALVVTSSVVLRILVAGQVHGDFEIMAVSSAIAVLFFLPYCQATRAHVTIDVFTARVPPPALRALAALWSLVLAVAAALLAWRLLLGLDEAWSRGDVTMMRRIPLFIVFAAAAIGVAGTSILALLDVVLAFTPGARRGGRQQ